MRVAMIAILMLVFGQVAADAIAFRDFRLLKAGMSEMEVLSRVGEPDRERVIDNDFMYRMIWYYVPDGNYSGDWSTTITFDANGRVVSIQRERFR